MSKPFGPIPPEFAHQTGDLLIANRPAHEWTAQHGSPLFLYDPNVVATKIAAFRTHFPRIDLHYAIKANPHPELLATVAPLVDGLDVASARELAKALAAKPAPTISFAGPGKRDPELEVAITAGATLNVESENEARRALAIAHKLGKPARLAVRVNPDMELKGSGMKMGGRPSPFGVDAERAAALVREIVAAGADWRGFHIFAGSQALDTRAIIETQAATLALAERLSDEAGHMPPLVNLGGGFGIPYFAGDTPINLAAIGTALTEALTRTTLTSSYAIELGRWLVAECGVYLTQVIDRKESRGETFLVTDGGLHHQLAASGNFGTVVRRNYPVAVAHAMNHPSDEEVSIVGCLCTPLDRLADKVALPHADVGDIIAIFLAGAYGATASPSLFLGHPAAAEVVALRS